MSGKPDSTFCDRRRKAAKAELLELAERMEREFTINSPDGKTHKMCAKEHPRMKGIWGAEETGQDGCASSRTAERGPGTY
ncbi:unnamed protein product [Bathycoccus prasinos]